MFVPGRRERRVGRLRRRLGLVGIAVEVLVADHSPQLAHRRHECELGDLPVGPRRSLGGDLVDLIERQLAAFECRHQQGELVDPAGDGDDLLGVPRCDTSAQGQPMRDRQEPDAEPAAVAFGGGGDAHQSGVLCVEMPGDLGDEILDVLRRHASMN